MPVHRVILQNPCSKCSGTAGILDDLGSFPPQQLVNGPGMGRFVLSCEACGGLISTDDDLGVVGAFFLGGAVTPSKVPQGIPPPHVVPWIPNSKPAVQQGGPKKTKSSASSNWARHAFNKAAPSKDNLIRTLTGRVTKSVKAWTMMEAYEANKKSATCVACGKPTAYHPSVSVLYCKCIESLPK